MTTKILTQEQAEAVYSAMCHLNNVGGRLHSRLAGRYETSIIHVVESQDGRVQAYWGDPTGNPYGPIENHANQSAFATAYGLQHGR